MGMILFPTASYNRQIPGFETGIDYSIEDSISFTEGCCTGCVGSIDMIGSTRITAGLSREKMAKYYSLFLNAMASAISTFGGIVVKNVGDGLLYYFPSPDGSETEAITRCLTCNLALVQMHHDINLVFKGESLPPLDYRISSDYGEIILARASGTLRNDIFGPTVNVCAKINGFASPNTAVIGGDLYQISKDLPGYSFRAGKNLVIGAKPYPVYTLSEGRSRSGFQASIFRGR